MPQRFLPSNIANKHSVALSVVGEADKVGSYEECFHKAAEIVRSIVVAK